MKALQRPEYGPPEIRALDQWVVTKLTPRPGRPNNKPPYIQDSHGGLRLASGPVDSRSHMPYAQAASLVRHHVSGMTWPGFVTLPTSHITGGDLDSCRNPRTGALGLCGPLGFHAGALVSYLPTYWSVSPSGRGLRFWARGEVPDGPRREGGHLKLSTVGLEMYSQGQYLTETGLWLRGTSTRAAPLQARLSLLSRAADALASCHAGGRSRLASLWGQPGNSESDLALANALGPFVSGDPEVLDLLLRLSGAYRDRWDSPRSGGSTWLREFVVRVALERPPPGSPSAEAPGDLVEKRLAYLSADAEARRRLSLQAPPPNITWEPSAAAWLSRGQPPVSWTVRDLWVEGSNLSLVAPYKTGKTTLLLDLLRHLLEGSPFLGFPCVAVPRVAYINAEMLAPQFASWMDGIPHLDRVSLLNTRGSNLDLRLPGHFSWMEQALRGGGYHTLVVDTLAGVYRGDINDNEGIDAFTKALDALKTSCGISNLILTHHMGRKQHEEGAEHGRGATRLDDWVDTRLVLTRGKDGSRWLDAEGRDVLEPEILIEYDEVTRLLTRGHGSRSSVAQMSVAARGAQLVTSVVLFVRQNPGCSVTEVRAGLRGRKAAVSAALDQALEEGRVEDRAEHLPGTWIPKQLYATETQPREAVEVRSPRSPRSPDAVRTAESSGRAVPQSPVKGTTDRRTAGPDSGEITKDRVRRRGTA